ncbi:hypothetical protein [Hymenobacter metallilatus]|uniref:Uncharacterized protein n=1 Tax=Hymenobacter metallilatus TaxID=2493666 RepID=A0A3R9NJE8_9BACT|nr:hypothetical protein [Hymenobacter metallilatus]RSK34588.1 hypothetical protein EI290_08155 [Hymenobacter metallilatus]
MITPSPRFRYYLAFTLLAVLVVLLRLSAQAGSPPAGTVQQRALAYSRYLAPVLRLHPHQLQAMQHHIEQHLTTLDSLAAQPTAPAAAYAQAEARYLTNAHLVLTPSQYTALLLLRERPATAPTPYIAVSTQ